MRYPLAKAYSQESGPSIVSQAQVAIIAHHSNIPTVSRSVCAMVEEFLAADYAVIVTSSSPFRDPLIWPKHIAGAPIVLRRPNLGHDFGSWSTALRAFPSVSSVDRVILTNDSLIGPFASLSPLLQHFASTKAAVWSLTESDEISYHLQSFFVGFRDRALAQPSLQQFFSDVRVESTKERVVLEYEVGLSRLISEHGLPMAVCFNNRELGIERGDNPTHGRNDNWEKLLRAGFPFLKRSFVHGRTPEQRIRIAQSVAELYGVDLADWW